MSISIHLHSTHRVHTGGAESVDVEGRTVGECLERLVGLHPGLGEALFDGVSGLRNNIEIWLNMKSAYPGELSRPTADGDRIHITVMLFGG